jgi:hypothetical protein
MANGNPTQNISGQSFSNPANIVPKNLRIAAGRYQIEEKEYNKNIESINNKLEKLEVILGNIIPKIEHIHGFSIHTAPYLASKADVSNAKYEIIAELSPKIEERMRSSSFYLTAGLIVALIALLAGWAAVPADFWQAARSKIFHESPAKNQKDLLPLVPTPLQPPT